MQYTWNEWFIRAKLAWSAQCYSVHCNPGRPLRFGFNPSRQEHFLQGYISIGVPHIRFPPQDLADSPSFSAICRFFIGHPVPSSLDSEIKEHGDIVLLPTSVTDGYTRLGVKVVYTMRWIVDHYKPAFVLKLDLDTYVRVPHLIRYLQSKPKSGFYTGHSPGCVLSLLKCWPLLTLSLAPAGNTFPIETPLPSFTFQRHNSHHQAHFHAYVLTHILSSNSDVSHPQVLDCGRWLCLILRCGHLHRRQNAKLQLHRIAIRRC